MSCQKCGVKLGLMIEEDDKDTLCVKCHPTVISNILSSKENFEKIKNWDMFQRIRNMKFTEEK